MYPLTKKIMFYENLYYVLHFLEKSGVNLLTIIGILDEYMIIILTVSDLRLFQNMTNFVFKFKDLLRLTIYRVYWTNLTSQ